MRLRADQMNNILRQLLGRTVRLKPVDKIDTHPLTYRGLVTDSNHLVAVVGGDLDFAHQSGAALAMVPSSVVAGMESEYDPDLLENYTEVANVVSRVVNEASKDRIRLDPGIEHEPAALASIVDAGQSLATWQVDIEGYGASGLGVWVKTAA